MLPECAYLVRGLWVCKSSLLFAVLCLVWLAAKYASNRKDGSKLQALCNAAKNCASLPHDELNRKIHLVAVPVHSVFVAKHEDKRALR